MRICKYETNNDYLLLITSKGKIKLEPFTEDIIRIVYTLEDNFSNKDSLIVRKNAKEGLSYNVIETDDELKFSTKNLQISINKETGAFTYMDANRQILVREPEKGGKILTPVDVEKTVFEFEEDTQIEVKYSADGMRAESQNYKKKIDRTAYHTKLSFEWDEEEALYGLGSHEEGIMNLRGHHRYLYQQNMKAVVPMLVSTKGYGLLIDSYSLMIFRDDIYGSYIWTDVDDEMDFYFIYGPSLDKIVQNYRHLTGKTPMLPKWAFGYVQSKERYKTQKELLEVVEEYRERKIPLDVIVLDWQSWPGKLWGEKVLDKERFPDPEGMMDDLHSMNARLMVSIWPIMNAGGTNHKEMKEKGFLLGNQATYNAFDEKARKLYWEQAYNGLFSKGIDAWWCDCTEPFEADWKGEVKPEPEERLKINTEEAKKYLDPEYVNAYSLLHSKGIYEGQRNTTDDKRVINLTRSAYAGQHRYGTITWSGDITAKWETLKKQIPEGLNFCVTGEPYWTTDIGAFFTKNKPDLWFWDGDYNDGCNDLGYRELYVRWFQYAAFLPMFRSHGTDTPREVWRFGESGSIFYNTLLRFLKLRYRLMPYIYSVAGMVTHMDYTMMRVLAFDFRSDNEVYNISDQFMFGPAFLVNPVTDPMYYGPNSCPIEGVDKTRSVYLPKGCDWYDFWTGQRIEGGQKITTQAPLEIMPLFVKSGSIVPMGPEIQYVDEKKEAAIELRIYPGQDAIFTIYEDEGDNYNYEKGKYSETVIKWNDQSSILTFEKRKGHFNGIIEERTYKIVLVSEANGYGVEEAKKYDKVVNYKGEKIELQL